MYLLVASSPATEKEPILAKDLKDKMQDSARAAPKLVTKCHASGQHVPQFLFCAVALAGSLTSESDTKCHEMQLLMLKFSRFSTLKECARLWQGRVNICYALYSTAFLLVLLSGLLQR